MFSKFTKYFADRQINTHTHKPMITHLLWQQAIINLKPPPSWFVIMHILVEVIFSVCFLFIYSTLAKNSTSRWIKRMMNRFSAAVIKTAQRKVIPWGCDKIKSLNSVELSFSLKVKQILTASLQMQSNCAIASMHSLYSRGA